MSPERSARLMTLSPAIDVIVGAVDTLADAVAVALVIPLTPATALIAAAPPLGNSAAE
jgi:hypothetical protein